MARQIVFGKKSGQKSITSDNPVFQKFLNDAARKHEELSIEEEVKYFEKIRAGDEVAKEKFIEKNLLFSVSIAKLYQNQGLSLLDLVQEANIGLIKAVETFDASKGFQFSSHAVWPIRGVITNAIKRDARLIKVAFNKIVTFDKITKGISLFEAEHGLSPSEEEILEITGISIDDVMDVNYDLFYLDQTFESGGFCSEEFQDPDEDFDDRILDFDKEMLKEEILKIIESSMSPRERIFIKESFLNPFIVEPNDDILADAMGVTNTAARQMRRRVFEKMKKRIIQSPVIMGLGIIN